MTRLILIFAALVLGGGEAWAQDASVRSAVSPAASSQNEQVRLNVSMNFFVPGPSGMTDQGMDAQERARRAMYQMAVHECAVLRDSIARECHMETINVNVSRHQGQLPEGFTVGANMNFRVILK